MTTQELRKMVNLKNCKQGDILITKHGSILEYAGLSKTQDYYPHEIKYLIKDEKVNNGELGYGTRNDDGTVFKQNRKPEDEDIVSVISREDLLTILAVI